MGILKEIFGFFKTEIQLNKEYYESLNGEEFTEEYCDVHSLYEQAIDVIFERGQASASILERHLSISFNAASDILSHFESRGIISKFNGSIPRKILAGNALQAKEMLNGLTPKRQSSKDFDSGTQVRTDTYTVYYAYGHVQKVFPSLPGSYYENRDVINAATFIVSDGVSYDLTNKQSIQSIPVPNYHIYTANKIGEELGVTGCIDYVLRMRAGLFWNDANFDLAIACLEKATQLMKYSSVGWQPKDFFRIVNWLNDLGKFKKAGEWKKWIEMNIPGASSAISSSLEEKMSEMTKESFKNRIKSCKEIGTDLVEIGDIGACCEKCAKYRKRVYSLHGGDARFPKFPKDYHWGCGLSGFPYIYGISEPSFECEDVVSYSNRPYIDDRTEEERENYIDRINKLGKEPPVVREPSLNRIIYYKLIKIIPDDMPKSLSGFSRMRNANSKNYQILVKKAEAVGFIFPKTLEEVARWPENQ